MAIQVVRRHARLEGAHESFYLAKDWSEMPRVRDTTAAFVFAVPAPGELVGAIIDSVRTTLSGGMIEHGERRNSDGGRIVDKSITDAVRRESWEEIQAELGAVSPLGYSIGRWQNSKLYRIAYCVAPIVRLTEPFVPSAESSARWRYSLDEMAKMEKEKVGGFFGKLGGPKEDPAYVELRVLALIERARAYGYL